MIEQGSDEFRARADDLDEFDVMADVGTDYPLPVKANIQFVRKRESIIAQEGFLSKVHGNVLANLEDVIGGEFDVDEAGVLRFNPNGTNLKLSMDETSSSVRSLVDLRLYLGCVATKGDLLIIDEPEANLHPKNQRRIARMLAQLFRLGLHLLVTTHSDYLVKELNLLMLMNSTDKRIQKIAEREKYLRQETVDPADLRLYVTTTEARPGDGPAQTSESTRLVPVPVTAENGIEIESFDREIEALNRIQIELLFGE